MILRFTVLPLFCLNYQKNIFSDWEDSRETPHESEQQLWKLEEILGLELLS